MADWDYVPGFTSIELPVSESSTTPPKLGLAEGNVRNELYETMIAMVRALSEAGREEEEDVLGSLMDELTGWCSPGSEL